MYRYRTSNVLSNTSERNSQVIGIEFELETDTKVTLFVSDINGKKIAPLIDQKLSNSGVNQQVFNGQHLAQGLYYCTVIADVKVSTQKMMLIK